LRNLRISNAPAQTYVTTRPPTNQIASSPTPFTHDALPSLRTIDPFEDTKDTMLRQL